MKISVVVPVYNSKTTLAELISRVVAHFKSIGEELELVLIDDASHDDSWLELKRLKSEYGSCMKIARLRSNTGQHNTLLAGLSIASGDVVVTMDDDLQNPPEEISKLLKGVDSGFDLIIGSYGKKQHAWYRNISGSLVDRTLRVIFSLPQDLQLTSFRAMKKHVADGIIDMVGVYPYLSAMALSQAGSVSNINVEHKPRAVGKSNYSLWRCLVLVVNILLNYSTIPVIFVGILCGLAFIISFSLGAWVILQTLLVGESIPGWASTMTLLAFSNAAILLCMFIFSIYISRLNRLVMKTKKSFVIAASDES